MPLPGVYTEATLKTFMLSELGETGVSLGLDTSTGLDEAVNEVIGVLGHPLSDETSTAGIVKVRAIARWQAWLAAWNVAAGRFDLSSSGDSLKQSDVFRQIAARLAIAEAAASRYSEVAAVLGGLFSASVTQISYPGDPYGQPVR